MSMTSKLCYLVGGLVVVLIVASLIGEILKRRLTTPKGQSIVQNMIARTNAWWAMIAILAVTFAAGRTTTILLFVLISYFALREFITLTPTRPGDHNALSLAFFVAIPLQYYLIWINWYALFAILIPVYAFLILPSISVLSQDTENFLERTAKTQWGLMIAVYCISHAPALLMLGITGYADQDALLLFYMMLVAQSSDVFQYIFGTLFGKTRIAPLVSPNKTVEGLLGGGLCAVGVGAAMWWITPFSPWQSAGMAFAIVVMGFLGGLVMSAIKRSLGAKDWGTMIKGHGGMLDRLDSICFAAPIFFHLTRYFFT
jgi:phosphatidate cytidylyltransferase